MKANGLPIDRTAAGPAGSRPRPGAVAPAACVVLAAGLAAYANSFAGGFVFDDDHAIIDNPHVRRLWPLGEAMAAPPQSSVAGRPLVSLTLAVNYALGGLDVRGYHAINLAIHLVAGLLLMGIVRRMLLLPAWGDHFSASATGLAAVAAALWVVHPVQTESVTYIIQRAESLMGMFYLATLYLALRAFQSPRPAGWAGGAVAACAAGMACKEVMVTAPLMVLLYDRAFVAGSLRGALRRRPVFYAALAGSWLLLAAILIGGPRSESAGFTVRGLTPWEYVRSQFGVVLHYLRLCLWPHPLCLDYDWPVAGTVWAVAGPGAVVLGLLGLTGWAWWHRRPASFAGMWFFVILAPTSSIVPIKDLAFEHRLYLPLAGALVLVVLGVWAGLERTWREETERRRRLVCGGLGAAAIAVCMAGTILRNRDYQDGLVMWSKTVALRPENARARSSLGIVRCARGDIAGALRACEEALRIDPTYAEAAFNLGMSLVERGLLAEGVAAYRRALEIDPGYYKFHNNLGHALEQMGRLDEAIEAYRSAARLRPDLSLPRFNLALALEALGRVEEAVETYRGVLAIEPANADARCNLGNVLVRLGRRDEAIREYEAVLRADGQNVAAQYNLALALDGGGMAERAMAAYRRALEIDPGYADARCNLGGLLVRLGRVDEGIAEYRRTIKARPDHLNSRFNLGSALATQGRVAEAAAEFEAVLRLSPDHAGAREALAALRRVEAGAGGRP
jgi:tetratricopeptide (TPR) repeat protein